MALTSDGFTLNVTLVDTGGNVANKPFDLRSADYATAVTDSNAILIALGAVTAAVIKGYSISQRFKEDALVLPAGDVQVENIGEMLVGLDGDPSKRATISIPAIDPSLMMAVSGPLHNNIDTTLAAVTDFVDLYRTTGGVVNISDGETVSGGILKATRIHRASRKG